MRTLRFPFVLPAAEPAVDASQEPPLVEEDLHQLTGQDQWGSNEKTSNDRDGGHQDPGPGIRDWNPGRQEHEQPRAHDAHHHGANAKADQNRGPEAREPILFRRSHLASIRSPMEPRPAAETPRELTPSDHTGQ